MPSVSHFILETFKNKFPLLVFILPDPILSLELVVLHRLRIVQINILGVEHVRTEIEHCPFVNLCRLIFRRVDLTVVLNKVADPLHKVTVLLLLLEVLFL